METTWFKLKKAFEYTVVGARGRPLYRFAKGKPQAVSIPEDVRKLRGMRDHFIECDVEGKPVAPGGGQPHVIARPKPISSRAFQERPPLPARSPSRRPTAVEQVRQRPPARKAAKEGAGMPVGESAVIAPSEDAEASNAQAPVAPESAPTTPSAKEETPMAAPNANTATKEAPNAPEAKAAPEHPANPELPFECPDCGKRFKSEQAVGSHRRVVHEGK